MSATLQAIVCAQITFDCDLIATFKVNRVLVKQFKSLFYENKN